MTDSVSKKREVLYTNEAIRASKTRVAEGVLTLLNEYKEVYQEQINEEAPIDEIVNAINTGNEVEEFIKLRHKEDLKNLKTNFPHIDQEKALSIFKEETEKVAEQLISIASNIQLRLKGEGITIEHFVLNDEFSLNSKVKGRIKNMSTTYCTNKKQKEVRDLANKLSKLIKSAIDNGVLASNRLGTNAENIININTGEINHRYIARL